MFNTWLAGAQLVVGHFKGFHSPVKEKPLAGWLSMGCSSVMSLVWDIALCNLHPMFLRSLRAHHSPSSSSIPFYNLKGSSQFSNLLDYPRLSYPYSLVSPRLN